MLDKSYQDVNFFASFRCGGDCKTGVLLRAEKTPQGYKGIYVSLAENDQAVYRVTLDLQGKELSREPLAAAGVCAKLPSGRPAIRTRISFSFPRLVVATSRLFIGKYGYGGAQTAPA